MNHYLQLQRKQQVATLLVSSKEFMQSSEVAIFHVGGGIKFFAKTITTEVASRRTKAQTKEEHT